MYCPFCIAVTSGNVYCSYNASPEKPVAIPLINSEEEDALNSMYFLSEDRKFNEILTGVNKYCEDMTFAPGSETWGRIDIKTQDESGAWFSVGEDYRPELFNDADVLFYATDLPRGTEARTNVAPIESSKPAVIIIDKSKMYDETVIAHELIHYYERLLFLSGSPWRDTVLISLCERLKSKIPYYNELVGAYTCFLAEEQVNLIGGVHSPLFLLKSFDIDLKMGKPLGTVFGYGRADDIQETIANLEAQAKQH